MLISMPISFILLQYEQLFIRKLCCLYSYIVLLLLDADVLHYIETELQTHYKNIKINKEKKWKVGELCIAQYHQNRKWYRGKIVQTLGDILQVRNNLLFSTIIFALPFS